MVGTLGNADLTRIDKNSIEIIKKNKPYILKFEMSPISLLGWLPNSYIKIKLYSNIKLKKNDKFVYCIFTRFLYSKQI